MAVKTITIDLDAYDLLARHKRPGQSFSRVIKEHFSRGKTAREFRALLRTVRLSDEAVDAMAAEVRARRKSPARVRRP